jgi:hypothetical protein
MSDGSRMKATVVSLTKKKGISWGMADLRTIWRMLAGCLSPYITPDSPSAAARAPSSWTGWQQGQGGPWPLGGQRRARGKRPWRRDGGSGRSWWAIWTAGQRAAGRANSREGAGGAGGGRTGLGLRRPWRWFVMVVRVGARRRVAGDAGKSSKAGHVTGLARSTERGQGPELTQGLGRHRP